ncbi:MAG: hypothetical protein WB799_14215, partial [Candidatus Sulfotelmatobacter sp.]
EELAVILPFAADINRIQEKLDQYLADTFPCSDPLPPQLFAESFSHSAGYVVDLLAHSQDAGPAWTLGVQSERDTSRKDDDVA